MQSSQYWTSSKSPSPLWARSSAPSWCLPQAGLDFWSTTSTPRTTSQNGSNKNAKKAAFKAVFFVREIRVELTRPCGHYLLRVARLPIPPSAHSRIRDCKYTHFFFICKKNYISTSRGKVCDHRPTWTVNAVTENLSSSCMSSRSGADQS